MAKAVTLKNSNDEEVYPVTDISLVNGQIAGAKLYDATVGSDKLTTNAVWTANIKDGAVTADKIDWTTLGTKYSTVAFDRTSFAANGTYVFAHLNITEPGIYLVFCGICCWHSAAVRRGYKVQVTAGTGTTAIYTPYLENYGTTASGDTIEVTTMGVVSCTANAVINGSFTVMNSTGTANAGGNPMLFALKIGETS